MDNIYLDHLLHGNHDILQHQIFFPDNDIMYFSLHDMPYQIFLVQT